MLHLQAVDSPLQSLLRMEPKEPSLAAQREERDQDMGMASKFL